jgi:hypothetical protein
MRGLKRRREAERALFLTPPHLNKPDIIVSALPKPPTSAPKPPAAPTPDPASTGPLARFFAALLAMFRKG